VGEWKDGRIGEENSNGRLQNIATRLMSDVICFGQIRGSMFQIVCLGAVSSTTCSHLLAVSVACARTIVAVDDLNHARRPTITPYSQCQDVH